jgi:hypothetical protein
MTNISSIGNNKVKTLKYKFNDIKFIEILFPLSILLASYSIRGISLTFWILGLYSVAAVLTFKGKYYINKFIVFFVLFTIFQQILVIGVNGSGISTIFNNTLESILVTFIVVVISNRIRIRHIHRAYLVISLIAMIGIIIQAFQVYVQGNAVVPFQIIPGLLGDTAQWNRPMHRPMGFFVEPEAYATFILPLLYLLLQKKKLIISAIVTFSILLSTSTLGVLMTGLMWIWFIKKSKLNIAKKIAISLMIIIVVLIFSQSHLFQYAFLKLVNIDISDNARLSQGFHIWFQMPFRDKIIGIGRISLIDYILNNSIWLPSMITASGPHKWSYVTTIAGVLIHYGIIGGIAFGGFLLKLLKDKKGDRFIIICIIALSFGRTLLFNSFFILWYTIYFVYTDKTSNSNFFVLKK